MVKNKIHILTAAIVLFLMSHAHAQFIGNFVEDRICSGADGNYIFLVDEEYMVEHNGLFPELYLDGRYFLIERSKDNGPFVVIDTLKPIQSGSELDAIFGEGTVTALLADTFTYDFKSEQDIINRYQSSNSTFDRLFLQPVKQLRAMGHAYFDKDVEKGSTYSYKIKWNDTGKSVLSGSVISGERNQMLDNFKLSFNQMSIASVDSLISGTWLQIGVSNKMAFDVNFYGKKTFDSDFKKISTKRLLYAKDTLKASIYHRVNSKEVWDVYAVPVDLLGNEGIPSDTATLIALSKADLPFPTNFVAKDTSNAIYLSWTPVTHHSFISSYMISKEVKDHVFQILDTIPLNQTSYLDYDVENGMSYNYDIQALPGPISNLQYKEFPSVRASGTHATRERALPPENIKLSHAGKYVRIDWEPVNDPNVVNYFVYSSLDPNAEQFETVGSIADTTFLIDSTLNDDFQHETRYYGVRSMSFNLKLSQLSNIVSIVPPYVKEVGAPLGLNVKRWENGNMLSWEADELTEDFTSAYYIYRRNNAIEPFLVIDSVSGFMEYVDKTAEEHLQYEYSVSAISVTGYESPLSVSQVINKKVDLPTTKEPQLARVTYKNIPPGIEINWLLNNNDSIQKVLIYRMLANTTDNQMYEKIAEVAAKPNRFWDKNVVENQTYLYTVSTIDSDGKESKKGFAKLIGRTVTEE